MINPRAGLFRPGVRPSILSTGVRQRSLRLEYILVDGHLGIGDEIISLDD
jgi:hypothetical protein